MRPSDDPAQILTAIQYAGKSGAKLLLVQLKAGAGLPGGLESKERLNLPWLSVHQSPQPSMGQRLLSDEVLKRAFVLKDVLVQQLPDVVRTFNIDRVAVTQSRGPERALQPALEEQLIAMMNVPVWILGRGMPLNLAMPPVMRRILVPVAKSPELDTSIEFAWQLAKSQRSALSVLHVFERSEDGPDADERNPFTVKSWLHLSSLRLSSRFSPIEISIRQGDPATEILEFNARKPHDLVLLRRSPDRSCGSGLHSGIVNRLCSEMPCPVLVLGSAIEQPARNTQLSATAVQHGRTSLRTEPLGMEG
jgi:nucleotide-binding universal stress UspA family protein